jgi:hypothetical protein
MSVAWQKWMLKKSDFLFSVDMSYLNEIKMFTGNQLDV